jgi:3-hydroxybutyrate dehydrogenase
MSLKDKVAVITGSTSGIGLGIAKGFARAGIHIVINGFGDKNEIESIRQQLEGYGVKAIYHPADMTQPGQIQDLIETAVQAFGSIDILVNNAGIQKVAPIDEFPPEKWDEIIAVNMSASFHTIRSALKHMRKQGWGRIINIASAHGLVASPFKSAYVTAKHGILGLTKTVALEVAQDNITCNAICPGYVKTPLVEKQITDTAKVRGISEEQVVNDVLLAAQWTKKFVTVEELAETALFLCSDGAQNITGIALSVDGGWTAA